MKTSREISKRRDSAAGLGVIDTGALPPRMPSTVVDFSGAKPKILRRGPVVLEDKLLA